MKVYLVTARRNFEDVIVDVTSDLDKAIAGEGWELDALELALYKRNRWTRIVPHDNPAPHTVTEWPVDVFALPRGQIIKLSAALDQPSDSCEVVGDTVCKLARPKDVSSWCHVCRLQYAAQLLRTIEEVTA